MKFSAAIGLLSICLAPATALSILDDDNKIPGESPLELCQGDHSSDLITIKNVDLAPNPPKAYVFSGLLSPHAARRTPHAAAHLAYGNR